MAFAVPCSARRHRAGAVRGVRADGRFDLGRAVGVHFPGLFGDARDGPTAQAPRAPRVWLDPVAELYGLGGRRHTTDGGGGVEVVAEQPGVQRFPAASFVAHTYQICDQDMVVDLGVTGSCRRMAGHGPGEAFCRRPQLCTPAPAALLLYDLVEVAHRGVTFGVEDRVHVLGPADHAQLCYRFVRADNELHARPHAVTRDARPPSGGVRHLCRTRPSTRRCPPRRRGRARAAPAPPQAIGVSPRDA